MTDTGRVPILKIKDRRDIDQGTYELGNKTESNECMFFCIFCFLGLGSGLHKLRYPGIRDMSTWSKFGAHGEHGDVFLFSNLGAL